MPSPEEAAATAGCAPSTRAASSPDDGSACLSSRALVLVLCTQLALLVLLAHRFRIEDAGFRHLLLLTLAGFLLHALLPERLRLPFFLLLSLAGIAVVLGPVNGAWVVGIGVVLFGICHLPFAFSVRVGTLVVVAALLVAVRSGAVDVPVPGAIWPVLGSMFMFRLILYLYSLRHGLGSRSWTRGLAYFFLLPNVCFPLFPVVDYTTFERTYVDGDRLRIAQGGIRWMAHGIVHLLLYRFVYHHLAVGPEDVASGPQLASFMLTNFLLYLRVSGQFHVIIGMLQLFGFNLPRANHHYLLASSFSDFWRRINIYWKDFMLKAVYYPSFFRFKHLGAASALSCSIVIVFVATWLLHAYQWFWLLGSFRLTWQDGTYWGLLAVLVLVDSKFERRRAAAPPTSSVAGALRASAARGLRVSGTLATMCVLWSLWTAESLAQWGGMWVRAAGDPLGPLSAWMAVLVVAGVGLLAGLTAEIAAHKVVASRSGGRSEWLTCLAARLDRHLSGRWTGRLAGVRRSYSARAWWAPSTGCSALIALLLILSTPAFTSPLGTRTAQVLESMRDSRLSDRDQALLASGYYERLLAGAQANPQVRQVVASAQGGEMNFYATRVGRMSIDFVGRELVPSSQANFRGALVEVNSMGMRDREYSRKKPAGTVRIAVLGASVTMGWGVGTEENFESQLEERLNRGSGEGGAPSYESTQLCGRRLHGARAGVGTRPPRATVLARRDADRVDVAKHRPGPPVRREDQLGSSADLPHADQHPRTVAALGRGGRQRGGDHHSPGALPQQAHQLDVPEDGAAQQDKRAAPSRRPAAGPPRDVLAPKDDLASRAAARGWLRGARSPRSLRQPESRRSDRHGIRYPPLSVRSPADCRSSLRGVAGQSANGVGDLG